jgi:hypothetical protein
MSSRMRPSAAAPNTSWASIAFWTTVEPPKERRRAEYVAGAAAHCPSTPTQRSLLRTRRPRTSRSGCVSGRFNANSFIRRMVGSASLNVGARVSVIRGAAALKQAIPPGAAGGRGAAAAPGTPTSSQGGWVRPARKRGATTTSVQGPARTGNVSIDDGLPHAHDRIAGEHMRQTILRQHASAGEYVAAPEARAYPRRI